MGSPQLSVSRSANAGAYSRLMNRSAQGGYGFRAGTGRPDRYRRPYAPVYGFGLPYSVGWIGPDYLDSLDSYDPGFYGSAFPGAAQDAGAYAVPGPGLDPGAAPVEEADAGPATMYRPAYQRPEPAPDPGTEAAVTLVFKDGRPNEQIHNYMLTRSTLYVQEQRMRQIPVADLDLDATQRVNKEAGVDFQLPAGAR
jgi:hypothetical protein